MLAAGVTDPKRTTSLVSLVREIVLGRDSALIRLVPHINPTEAGRAITPSVSLFIRRANRIKAVVPPPSTATL